MKIRQILSFAALVVSGVAGCSAEPTPDQSAPRAPQASVEQADSRISRESFVDWCKWTYGSRPHYSTCRTVNLGLPGPPPPIVECKYKSDGTPDENLFQIQNPDNCNYPITWGSGGRLWNSHIICYEDKNGAETTYAIDARAYPGQAVFEITATTASDVTTDVNAYVTLAGATSWSKGNIEIALQVQGDDGVWRDVGVGSIASGAPQQTVHVSGRVEPVRNVKLLVRGAQGITPGAPFQMYDARMYGPECVYDETSGGCYK